MKLYISGPMSGVKAFNIPEFDSHARALRAMGHEVVSPAELDEPAFRRLCMQSDGSIDSLNKECDIIGLPRESWGDLLARDVKLLADDGIEGIVVLPGWDGSRGALLETYVGRLCGLPIYKLGAKLVPLDREALKYAHAACAGYINGLNTPSPDRPFVPLHECGIPPMMREPRKPDGTRLSDWDTATGETRVTSETGGQKGSKRAVIGDICPKSLKLLAEVAGFGREKYDRLNYLKGFDYSLAYDAAQRHLNEFWQGNDIDDESGLPHLAHAAWQCLCLLAFYLRGVGKDDRP